MTVVIAWLRLDVGRRWRSLVVLTLLIAVAGGIVLASLAGARRAASAIERLKARTLPADAVVFANTPGFDWTAVEHLPEVAVLTKFIVNDSFLLEGIDPNGTGLPPADGAMMTTIEKPVIFAGRVFDPTRDDEAVVTPKFVRTYHKGVGDQVVLDLPSPEQLTDLSGDQPTSFKGPHITVRIVGVGISPWASQGDGPNSPGGILISPGVVARHPQNTLGDASDPANPIYVNALLRLRGGEAAISRLRGDLVRITGRADIEVWDLGQAYGAAQRQVAFEARCLVAFAGAVLLAALVLIGQAIARYAAAGVAELQTLRAVGMTPRQAIATAAAGPTLAGATGAVLSGVLAFVAAAWFPIGSASFVESDPGMQVDWVVFGPVCLLIGLLTVAGAAAAAALALGAARRPQPVRPSGALTAVARAGAAVPVVVGIRFALEAGRRPTAVPVRPAIGGAVVGVLGVVAAFTFSHGVSDAAGHPERFGQTYHVAAFLGLNGRDFAPADKVVAALLADPDVSGVDDARTAVATGPAGSGSVSLYVRSSGSKVLPAVLMSGRMPESADEVALAPRSLAALHTQVGGQVALSGSNSAASATRFKVTGVALVPAGPHNAYSDGGWLTASGYNSIFDGFKFHFLLVALRPNAQSADALTRLNAAVVARHPELEGVTFARPDPLPEIAQLREVRVLPNALGLFLVLLAVGAVGHALATAVRRRSHDLAVLRALGMTQWQCRWVVVTHATVLAAIGLIFGVPLGLAIGRSVWRVVADLTPLQYVSPFAVWTIVLVWPATLLVAILLTALPSHRAARLPIAQILRTE